MPFALNFYHDQLGAGGATSAALPPAHRLLYVRHGSAQINGKTLSADEAIYADGELTLRATGAWSQVWRWELALPNAAPAMTQGDGVLTHHRMMRVITSLACRKAARGSFASTRSTRPPAVSPTGISIRGRASAVFSKAASTCSRTPRACATWRPAMRGGRRAATR